MGFEVCSLQISKQIFAECERESSKIVEHARGVLAEESFASTLIFNAAGTIFLTGLFSCEIGRASCRERV